MRIIDNEKVTLIAAFLLMVIAILVTFKRKKSEPAVNFLSLYFWCFSYLMFMAYLVSFGYVLEMPHFYRTGLGVSLLMMPAAYLYIRQTLLPRKLRYLDLVHLLPFLFYLVNYTPFLLQSAEYKIRLIQSYSQQELAVGFSEGLFMPQYAFSFLRYAQVALYAVLQWMLISKVERSKEHPVSFASPETLSWMKMLVISELILLVPPVLGVLFMGVPSYGSFAIMGGIVMALIQCYYLFSHPEILYGISNAVGKEVEADESLVLPAEAEEERESYYTEHMLDEAGLILERYMIEHKPYLRAKFKLQELAEATGLSVHRISAYVNRRKNMNFFGYLNQFRVRECIDKLSQGEHESKTLEALSEECGFQNRTTFIRVFKQVTGKTPTQYIAGQR